MTHTITQKRRQPVRRSDMNTTWGTQHMTNPLQPTGRHRNRCVCTETASVANGNIAHIKVNSDISTLLKSYTTTNTADTADATSTRVTPLA